MIDPLNYDNKVLNGEIVAGRDIKLACKIDKISRNKTKDPDYPYYYDKDRVERFISLAQAISEYPLAPFQVWWLSVVHGYYFKSDHDVIKHNSTILSMARKNAKSYLSSVALLTTLIDAELKGKHGLQLYLVASKKAQAMLSLRTCRLLMKRLQGKSELARHFKLNKDIIYSTVTGSYIKALPSRSKNLDGARCDGVVLDEVHSFTSSKLRAVMQSAMMQSPGAVLYMTSTSGFDASCPFAKDWSIAEKELQDLNTKSRSFNAIFTQDSKDEIYKDSPKSWQKSNPLLCVEKLRQPMKLYLKDQLNRSSINGRSNEVLVKNFNLWGSRHSQNFISPDKWKINTIKNINLDHRSNVCLGLDLSRIHDQTAVALTVKLGNKFYTTVHGFIADADDNIQRKSKQDHIDYLDLENQGYVTISRHSYGLIDYRLVVQYIRDFINVHDLHNVILGYDPWQAGDVVNMLGEDNNISLVKVSQSVKNLTNTIQWLYRLILSHKLVHDDNPLYQYAFDNLKSTYNVHGNIYLTKDRSNSTYRIDPVFALLDSLYIQHDLQKRNKTSLLKKELHEGKFIF